MLYVNVKRASWHWDCVRQLWTQLSLFPQSVKKEESKFKMTRVLQKVFFSLVMVAALGLSVSAQKDDKKPPPKEKPPVVKPGDKPPKQPEPTPKKPSYGSFFVVFKSETTRSA